MRSRIGLLAILLYVGYFFLLLYFPGIRNNYFTHVLVIMLSGILLYLFYYKSSSQHKGKNKTQ
jgi:chromate transport protein ChrA